MKTTREPAPATRVFRRRTHLLAFALALAGVASLRADLIPISNYSFESANYSGANSWTNNLDSNPPGLINWTGRDGNNSGQTFIERIGGFASHGLAHIGMENNYFVYWDTGLPWQPNTKYTLTVGVGNRNTAFTTAGNQSVIGLTDTPPVAATMAELLTNDPFLAGANASKNCSTQPASSFQDITVPFTTGPAAPPGTIVVVLGDTSSPASRSHFDNVRLDATSLLDPDGDGLPSPWESANGLNPNSALGNDGAAGDPDADGSPNSQEFTRATNPQDNDSDNDNALDGAETLTGIYAPPNDLGTDPLNPDTDGDTLLDGNEPGAATPTDPNKPDTDGDEFEDQAELAAGTNPSVGGAGSFPASAGDFTIGLNFVGGRVDGTPGASVDEPAGVFPQSNWNNLVDLGGSGAPLKNHSGAATIMRASWTVDDTYTITTEVPADSNSRLMQGYLKTRIDVLTQVVVRNNPYPSCDVYVYADGDGADSTVANYTVNGTTISGVIDDENWPVGTGGGVFRQVTSDNTAGNVIVFRNVTGPTITVRAINTTGTFGAPINGIQINRNTEDTDDDGMPNQWEDANGTNKNLNDAAADPDADGSPNLQEFQRLTNPQNPDSDNDTLKDGVETKTGTFVSASNTGTDPLKADTDGDGLADGTENNSGNFVDGSNPGTNPTKADTDGDGFGDNEEISAGTSPVNAASKPAPPVPIGYWPFNDQNQTITDDASPGGNDGTVGGTAVYVPGHSGAANDFAIQFNGTDTAITTGVALLDSLPFMTMSGWIKFTVDQPDRTGLWGQNDVFEWGYINATTIEGWTQVGGATQAPGGQLKDDAWHHLAVRDDGTSKTIFIDGAQAATGATGAPLAATGGSFNIGGGGVVDATGNFFNGLIDDVAVWDVALSDTHIGQLASRAITPLGSSPPPGMTIRLVGNQVEITWTPGSLVLQRSTDLGTWTDVTGATSPYSTAVDAAQAYFRARE